MKRFSIMKMNIMKLSIMTISITSLLLGHIVDAALIPLPIGVHHGSSITSARVTLALHVPLLLAVPTHNVGVAGHNDSIIMMSSQPSTQVNYFS